ncbi:MAG: flagellar assembly protein T N-terminal domain-containing protein [Pseudomonadota bacterium]
MSASSVYALVVLSLLFCSWNNAVSAREIEAEGMAVISDGAYNAAREKAIKEALRQAMLQTTAQVDSTSVVSTNVLIIDSARVSTAGTTKDTEIIDEWTDEDILHVRIRTHVPKDGERNADPAARYRKKVAVLQFEVLDRRQVFDFPEFERELPLEIQRRLQTSGEFIAIDATRTRLAIEPNIEQQKSAVNVAGHAGAQILIVGTIRDMGVHERPLWLSTRRLEIEIAILDGISGMLVGRHRLSENVARSAWFAPRVNVFSNAEFMRTGYGHALDRILDRQVDLIRADLAQLPFSAHIVRVEGKKVYIDAGSATGISVGDLLMTYRVATDPVTSVGNGLWLGFKETPMTTIDIKQVQPLFAIGELEGNKDLRPGDMVRFGGDGYTLE